MAERVNKAAIWDSVGVILPRASSHITMIRLIILFFGMLIPSAVLDQDATAAHFSTFEEGGGPSHVESVYRLLDGSATPGQSNAVAFDVAQDGAYEQLKLSGKLRVLLGGDGGAFAFLNTAEYGKRGPAPFVKSWVEPNLNETFAVGIDVHNPPNNEQFGPWGNYQGLPEREVSLHWDGREIVKRVAPAEFRGDFTEFEISVQHVIGGAEVTVRLAGEAVYDRYFIAGMHPYKSRLAIGAGTRDDSIAEFDVDDLVFTSSVPAQPRRNPKHFEIFNHVMTKNPVTSFEKEVTLPPLNWAYGRIILTLEIHDAGPDWPKWDLNGSLYIVDPDSVKRDIVPFITSFRTPCHWEVDVTHFRPWLAGNVKFEIATGMTDDSDQGYMMSASLDFYHGTPELEPYRIVPLWVGTAKYKSVDNHFSDFFTPQAVSIDKSRQAARLFITTTGHSKIGEFTPSRRTVIFAPEKGGDPGAEQRFENVLWKTDCYLNPNRPQFGSWKYSRAGWAPGDVVRPWWIDLTPYIIPGKTAELRYEPEPYDFSGIPADQQPADDQINQATQLVRAYLILYHPPVDLIPAPTLQVLDVAEDSNASKAGIQAGDYLESYNGKQPNSIDDLRTAINDAEKAGKERIKVVIYRGTERMEVELGPGLMGVTLEEL